MAFDWRQVQLRKEDGGWKLAAGSCVLADFGTDEHAARQGLSAMQYYRFTERRQVGGALGEVHLLPCGRTAAARPDVRHGGAAIPVESPPGPSS